MKKEDFIEAWNEHIEPLFEDGTLIFECSDKLKEHLLKVSGWEYSDDEIMELIEAGRI